MPLPQALPPGHCAALFPGRADGFGPLTRYLTGRCPAWTSVLISPYGTNFPPPSRSGWAPAAFERSVSKGTVIHDGSGDCAGLLVVLDGQLRAYILSQEGREVTLYRLFPGDICLFSASCAMNGLGAGPHRRGPEGHPVGGNSGRTVPAGCPGCAPLANYVSQLMASRFAQVTWLLQQILWQRQDKRLAAFLVEESAVEGSQTLSLTHDRIASHLGTAGKWSPASCATSSPRAWSNSPGAPSCSRTWRACAV